MSESELRTLLWLCWARLKETAPDSPLTKRVGEVLNNAAPAKEAP